MFGGIFKINLPFFKIIAVEYVNWPITATWIRIECNKLGEPLRYKADFFLTLTSCGNLNVFIGCCSPAR